MHREKRRKVSKGNESLALGLHVSSLLLHNKQPQMRDSTEAPFVSSHGCCSGWARREPLSLVLPEAPSRLPGYQATGWGWRAPEGLGPPPLSPRGLVIQESSLKAS